MTIVEKENGKRKLPFDQPRLERFIDEAAQKYPHISMEAFKNRVCRKITSRESISAHEITNLLILNALEYVGVDEGQHPDWTFIAGYFHLKTLYKQASKNRFYKSSERYGDLYVLLRTLTTTGIYDDALLVSYSKEEIDEIGTFIVPERDELFTYIGLRTLADRYLATDHEKNVYELPQERFLIIAMKLMQNETKEKRLSLIKEAYWALSNLYMTVATPTLANAGKSYGQLSSCFIDTVDDSLIGIYDSNTDVARLSKNGGGIGKLI